MMINGSLVMGIAIPFRKPRGRNTFSLGREKTLPLVKDEDGSWRAADEREFESGHDFMPLEVIRQDNADKSGWSKYRFRKPIYTPQADDMHDHPMADGWYTSHWQKEPNYWSSQFRAALSEGMTEVETQLQGKSVDLVLVTEGGIAKGTSTSGTDLDTRCIILGDSPSDFENAYLTTSPIFADKIAALPFAIKKGEGMWFSYFERSTGKRYFSDSPGIYSVSNHEQLFEGNFVLQVSANEKLGITKFAGFQPHESTPHADEFVSLDIASGEVFKLEGEELERYKQLSKSYAGFADLEVW